MYADQLSYALTYKTNNNFMPVLPTISGMSATYFGIKLLR
ncbi:hypothetical protein SALWKB12_1742 [Snodgrassella communis]|uniref:Uncharacterized protein n=1 Tax=Snodgrassella communis TaxID=2946699 RepID=A0A836MQH9_9NEIS|nr:hypothetical protein SALWKB12_1742 [Snodgrassella communis]KDN14684.1 hypothetical protein SALWKB29_1143 [Snodgrassella communis]